MNNKDNIIIKYNLNNSILKKFLKLKQLSKIERIQYSYSDDYYNTLKNDELIGCNIVIKNINITNKFLKEFHNLKNKYQEYDFLEYIHDEITFFCLKNKNINKSSTIKYLEEILNINHNDIYVFGDNENDYSMLSSFNGYYIGNVDKKIKDVCIKGYSNVYNFLENKEK